MRVTHEQFNSIKARATSKGITVSRTLGDIQDGFSTASDIQAGDIQPEVEDQGSDIQPPLAGMDLSLLGLR